tara:strand:- start:885 stop:1082 length:198 start_codon:yes stop_codon:yes gene_type:complete
MENKEKIYRVDIIEWQNGLKDLVYALTPDSEEVFSREATEADLKWHKRQQELDAQPDEQFVYGLF